MPGGDGTGPGGLGPMTGRAAGFCAGYPVPGYASPTWGRGYGMGFGRGRGMGFGRGGWGRRNWFYATGLPGWQRASYGYPAYGGAGMTGAYYNAPYPPPPAGEYSREDELRALRDQSAYMEESLNEIKKRMAELETQAE